MGDDDPEPMRFTYRDFSPPAGATAPSDTLIDPHKPDGHDRICTRDALAEDVLRPNLVLMPIKDPTVLIQVREELWSHELFGDPIELGKLEPKEVGLLQVLSDRTLLARTEGLPSSAKLMIAGKSVPIAQQQGGVYRIAAGASLADVSTGQTLVVAQNADTLTAIGSADAVGVLTSGSCSTAFSLNGTRLDGDWDVTPSSACRGDLRLLPVAAMGDNVASSSLLGSRGIVRLEAQSSTSGVYRPVGEQVVSPGASEWTGALERVSQSGVNLISLSGTPPQLLLPEPERNLADASRVLSGFERLADKAEPAQRTAVLAEIDNTRLDLLVAAMDGPEEVMKTLSNRQTIPNLTEDLKLQAVPLERKAFPVNFGSSCEAAASDSQRLGSGYGRAAKPSVRALAASATKVTRGDGTAMVAYYNATGDVVRIYEPSRGFYDELEWDIDHNLLGKVRRSASSTGRTTKPTYLLFLQ